CLRLLRSPDDIEDVIAEIPPESGTLVAFRCRENAWHGHKPFDGIRRSVQLNWVVDEAAAKRSERRHGWSSLLKRLRIAG
ncbi:MAG: 2OG-Fe(II) oxygenase, partial [Anaerolineae bacterium]